MPVTRSPLAHPIGMLKDLSNRTVPLFGIVLHTTGSSIVEQAQKLKVDPLEHVVAYYTRPEAYSAHYVIGHDGTTIQISDEKDKCLHVGLSAEERTSYLDGSWAKKVSKATYRLWQAQWGSRYKSPSHLYPGPSVNNVYVGIEMLPLLKPTIEGVLFTERQHRAAASLAKDIAQRWGFPKGWQEGPRLLGHEDVQPLTRSNAGGGWDPGSLRDMPVFGLAWVREMCLLGHLLTS